MKVIDLNCDMGEIPELHTDGTQERLMGYVSSVNIACGAHAGDPDLMEATIRSALRHGVAIGAHPGYPDRENFGRLSLEMTPEEIAQSVAAQIEVLAARASISHVKPHGALYNDAAAHDSISWAIAEGVARWRTDVVLVGLAGSNMLTIFAKAGFKTAAEAFADRQYEADGTLRLRRLPGALLTAVTAGNQAVRIVRDHLVTATGGIDVPVYADTLCIHSDTPDAVAIASEVVRRLAAYR